MSAISTIGPYRVVRPLAQGGMSSVFEVTDPDTGASLAVKLLHRRDVGLARFEREYRALTRIDHPNVVRVFRYGETPDGAPYVVMELLQGVPAQVRVKSIGRPGEPARTAEAARIALGVAEALAHLHGREIVHRDLKSNNVMILGDGTVKLLDFGTALLLRSREQITGVGEFVGTFAYASPEQIVGGAVDARADLYALGVLFYRMLTARRPFEAETPHALARMHLHLVPPSPRQLVPDVPEDLSSLTMHLLAKEAGDRPATASDVARRLVAFAGGEGADLRPNLRFIGRQDQLGAMQAWFSAAAPGSALLFAGAPGSGRGRLVDLALEDAQVRGFRAFPLDMSGGGLRALAFLVLDSVSELDPPQTEGAAREAAREPGAETLAAALAMRASVDPFPVVIGCRTLHRATRTERELVLDMMRSLRDRGAHVLLVGTSAEGETAEERATVVPVPPLTGAEVAVLASHWLGVASVPPELVRRLLAASGGMPTPLEELVRALPRNAPDAAIVVPGTVRDALLIRIDGLSRAERRVAEAIALAEGDFDAARLAAAVDEPTEEVTAALAALLRDRFVLHRGSGMAFRIGVTAELVRERMRPTRRRLVVERLAAQSAGLPPTRTLAEILIAAGDVPAAVRVAVAWAEPLVRTSMHADALPLLDRVLDALGEAEAPEAGRAWRLFAECLAEVRHTDERVAQAVARAGELAATDAERGEVELVAARLARARGDSEAERTLLHAAALRLRDDPRRLATARERLAEVSLRVGELMDARRHARDAIAAFPTPRAAATLALVMLERGAVGEAEREARRIIAEVHALGRTPWRASVCLAQALRLQGRWSEALLALEPVLAAARSEAPARRLASVLFALADIDLELFRLGQARDRVAQALDALRGELPSSLDATHALLEARLASEADDYQGALVVTESAYARASGRGMAQQAAELRAVRAVLMRHLGRGDVAAVEFKAARTALSTMGAVRSLAWLAALRARAGHGEEPAGELFADVVEWAQRESARPTRVEYALAVLRHARRRGQGVEEALAAARQSLADLRVYLSSEDAAALAVHPWTRTLGAA